MHSIEKWLWLPILSLMAGGATPLFFVNFPEGSWHIKIWGGMFATTSVVAYFILKKIGNKIPTVKKWARDTLLGITALSFLSALITSGLSVLFALLPIPIWLHFITGLTLAGFAMVFLLNEKPPK